MSCLRDYLDYASNNEAPEMFHVWCAYFCLSTAISRRVWMPFADTFIYPNIFVLLVGAAGNGKSEALQRAKRLLAKLNVPISGSIETPEGLWRYMAGNPGDEEKKIKSVESPVKKTCRGPYGAFIEYYPMAIIANEFVNFIGPNPDGWVAALNDIYDCHDYIYRTKGQGTDVLRNPYLTLLGALTTEVSADLQKQRIISTGLSRRTFFQFGERKWDQPQPEIIISLEERAARQRVIDHLRALQRVCGPMSFTPAARKWYHEWYCEHNPTVPSMAPNLRPWYGTKPMRLQELAMLTSLSEGTDLVIDVPHLEIPLDYLTILERDLSKIFGGVGRNELAAVAQRIFEYIAALPFPQTKNVLRSRFFSDRLR
jgi:hypothetical protein